VVVVVVRLVLCPRVVSWFGVRGWMSSPRWWCGRVRRGDGKCGADMPTGTLRVPWMRCPLVGIEQAPGANGASAGVSRLRSKCSVL